MLEITFIFDSMTVTTSVDTDSAETAQTAVEVAGDILKDEYGLETNRASEVFVDGEEFLR